MSRRQRVLKVFPRGLGPRRSPLQFARCRFRIIEGTMAKPGALSTKREQLEMLVAISLHFEGDLSEKIVSGEGAAAFLVMEAVDLGVKDMLRRFVGMCCGTLAKWDEWAALAADPKEFNSQLDLYLNATRMAMRLLYRIPDHRPRAQDNNPQKVAALKKKYPDASWGQLSQKFQHEYGKKLPPKAVERAYSRFVKRVQDLVKRGHRMAHDFQKQKLLSENEQYAGLPTPELVLDILTGKTSLPTT